VIGSSVSLLWEMMMSLSAPPDPLAAIGWCLLLKGREWEKGRKGLEGEGRGGDGRLASHTFQALLSS